jgi:hypothetical protein
MININKEELEIWIDALRSGEYKQIKGKLNNLDGYCCLGVACKVLIPNEKLNLVGEIILGSFVHDQINAPQWLRDINVDFESKTGITLSMLNDKNGASFNEIADILEKTYLTPNE